MNTQAGHCFARAIRLMLLSISVAMQIEIGLAPDVLAESRKKEPTIEFNIAPQALKSALNAFAVASGWQVRASSDYASSQQSPGLIGTYTPEQGLRTLLADTGVTYRVDAAQMIVLEPGAMAQAVDSGHKESSRDQQTAKQSSSKDEPVIVKAAPVVVEGQKVRRTLQEVPAGVRVLDAEKAEGARAKHVWSSKGYQMRYPKTAPTPPPLEDWMARPGRWVAGQSPPAQSAESQHSSMACLCPQPLAPPSSLTTLWDVNTIEVARGPQATSGGRNSIAGAVRIETNDPIFDFEGAARANYFNRDGTFGGAVWHSFSPED